MDFDLTRNKKVILEEEIIMSGTSSVDELRAFTQETVAVEGSAIGVTRSTTLLKATNRDLLERGGRQPPTSRWVKPALAIGLFARNR